MSRKTKSKKSPAQQQVGGYKRFLIEMHQIVELMGFKKNVASMSPEFKEMMYARNLGINSPLPGNENINKQELKIISDKTKKYYREPSIKTEDIKISNYQVQLLFCYNATRHLELIKKKVSSDNEEVIKFKNLSDSLFSAFYNRFLLDYFRVITQLSRPDQKYYGVHIRPASQFGGTPRIELVTKIYGIPASKYMMKINGNNRPAFQLGRPLGTTPVEWISLDVSLLGDFYKGKQKKLSVYIQSHALKRLSERMDLLDQEAINYALWENTNNITNFELYRGYLLLPFKVFGVKIGYLVANVIDDKLLFRTFLFITHNCTPEGDQLKKISGLAKEDISYWRIDRLSTFVKLNEEKYHGLIRLFSKAGLGDLMKLKIKEFDIDTIQTANLDGLTEYLKQGQHSIQEQERKWNLFFDEKKVVSETIND